MEKAGNKSRDFDNFKVYAIICNDINESFIKIGKTFKTVSKRFPCNGSMPYGYDVFFIITGAADFISKLESVIQRELSKNNFGYSPSIEFSGDTECFILNSNSMKIIITMYLKAKKEEENGRIT